MYIKSRVNCSKITHMCIISAKRGEIIINHNCMSLIVTINARMPATCMRRWFQLQGGSTTCLSDPWPRSKLGQGSDCYGMQQRRREEKEKRVSCCCLLWLFVVSTLQYVFYLLRLFCYFCRFSFLFNSDSNRLVAIGRNR